jgi:transcriptional regulator with GAF, ATPase, and Fis domain
MSAQIGWASETPVVKHAASFEIEEAVSAHVALDRSEQRGSGPPKIISNSFSQIIGNSPALETVLEQVERVATTDSTVLIEGETGTGKELIARAIHNLSSRCGRAFIKLNCAAIPLDLLESELFGHERGAFTGAIAQKIGRFEMADKGTLYLDEVGDIPPALQPKLLRVLQEQEFERLGSTRTHQVTVRLVAATNRDLAEMVNRGEFRSDLYFRLNVFPLKLPPLRERREDIPALVTHFVQILGRRLGRQIEHIPPETMSALSSYHWPGNIRELQNLIERAMILSNYGVLPNPLPAAGTQTVGVSPAATTLKDSERAMILRALEATSWVIGGLNGAAARLGLKRTTLICKMQRLGICRPGLQSSSDLMESASLTPALVPQLQ